MPVGHVQFSALRLANCAFLDTTSVQTLIDARVSWFLTHTDSSLIASEPLRRDWGICAEELNHALDVLARFVAYDFLVVDGAFLETAKRSFAEPVDGPPLGAEFLRTTSVPIDVYRVAAEGVLEAADVIRFDWRNDRHWLNRDDGWDGIEKTHIDGLFEELREIRWIRNTDQSLPRALFYTELARLAKVPLFISRAKDRKLSAAGRRWIRDALRVVQSTSDAAVFKATYAAVLETYQTRHRVEWPPLVRYMLAIAAREHISIYETALRLRHLPAAVAFRSWLGTLQRMLLDDSSASQALTFEKTLRDLGEIATEWGNQSDASFGVRFKSVKADLKTLPGIGTILQLFGRNTVNLKDPILNPRTDYLVFISNWYAPIRGW